MQTKAGKSNTDYTSCGFVEGGVSPGITSLHSSIRGAKRVIKGRLVLLRLDVFVRPSIAPGSSSQSR